jgi:hypothetical protein
MVTQQRRLHIAIVGRIQTDGNIPPKLWVTRAAARHGGTAIQPARIAAGRRDGPEELSSICGCNIEYM